MRGRKQVVGWILGSAALLLSGSFFGSGFERQRQAKKAQSEESVDLIAIVNMDEGTAVGEEHINYASQLLQMPGDNYVATGLNEAKAGIENGVYAAYIVIPENFSESVVSVEGNPQKILLKYAFNQKLDEQTAQGAISDVNAFETALNTNIAYMYIDAIMTAFHDVQDDASTILKNDYAQLEQLQGVDAEQLIIPMEQPEQKRIENTLQPVEPAPYLTENATLLENMLNEFDTSIRQGVEEYAAVRTGHQNVTLAKDAFFLMYGTVLTDTAVRDSAILADGKSELEDVIALFNQDIAKDIITMEERIQELAEIQRTADEDSANQQYESAAGLLESAHEEELQRVQLTWEDSYRAWSRYVEDTAVQQGNELLTEWQKQVDESLPELIRLAYRQGAEDVLVIVEENVASDIPKDPDTPTDSDAPPGGNGGDGTGVDASGDGNTGATETGAAEDDLSGDGNGGDGTGVDASGDGKTEGVETGGTGVDASGDGSPGGGDTDGSGSDSGETPDVSYTSEQIHALCEGIRENLGTRTEEYIADQGDNVKVRLTDTVLEKLSIHLTDAMNAKGEPVVPPELETMRSEKLPEMEIVLDTAEDLAPEAVTATAGDFAELFMLQDNRQEISDLIQSVFLEKLTEEGKVQMERLSDTEKAMSFAMEDYERSLLAYDPFFYLEPNNLTAYLDEIGRNSSDMLLEVEKSNMEYVKLSDEVYMAANEYVGLMQDAYEEAAGGTARNVQLCMGDLQSERAKVNGQNTRMLENFSLLLPYTRVGSQGNTEVYEHIANPVVSVRNGSESMLQSMEQKEKSLSVSEVLAGILLVGITVCIIFMLHGVLRRAGERSESGEVI